MKYTKDENTGLFKYELKPGKKITIYPEAEIQRLLKDKEDLLEALKVAEEDMSRYASYRRSEGWIAGNIFLDSAIERVKKAIEHCRGHATGEN